MAIGSHVFATAKHSPPARKNMPLGEFLLTLFVVIAATLVGAAGGIWLAERGRPADRQEAVSPQTPPQQANRAQSTAPVLPRVDLPTAKVSKTVVERPGTEVIRVGLPSIRSIHHSAQPDYTEIAIELRAADLLHVARLQNPERVYFDLADSGRTQRPKGRLKSRREVSLRDERVAGIRVVRWESGSVRVVVDLKRRCEYSYRLDPGPGSLLTLRLWTHPAADTLAGQTPQRQGASGISEALGADRP